MGEKEIGLGDVFYVFCNWGLCKGHVVKIEKYLIDRENIVTVKQIGRAHV